MRLTMDLNADVGEETGDDRALLALVSSANIAAGGHAGGGDVLLATVAAAIESGCALGAHPSYVDREGFGRRRPPQSMPRPLLVEAIATQIVDVGRACQAHGGSLAHVKPHGTLYNDAADDLDLAGVVFEAVDGAASRLGMTSLAVVGLAGSLMEQSARAEGRPFIAEAFADRAYDAHGRLVPRTEPGAVLDSPELVGARVVDIAINHRVIASDGTEIRVAAQSICLHGDTRESLALAHAARSALASAGVAIAPVWAAS